MDFTFPFKYVIKSMVIDTDVDKYLRAFTLQSSETDYISKGFMSDVEHCKGQQVEFTVFETPGADLLGNNPVLSRVIHFPKPLFTR